VALRRELSVREIELLQALLAVMANHHLLGIPVMPYALFMGLQSKRLITYSLLVFLLLQFGTLSLGG
jgi:hypothetical protein